ncbi:unnamed protein product [Clonostachys chloroleuca]|uniref:Heterokaryon incompatibility domain-containing protein n=1 Tax=Clonostachys chloroleuca TaxID=1926264 RepID=A0AA35QFE6_9HYPO|nr:unnamed protein product [Clonostachys chloroleuca]
MLCEVCSEVLQGIWDPAKTQWVCRLEDFYHGNIVPPNRTKPEDPNHPENYIFGHHITQESFKKSALDGCVVCSRFRWTQQEGQDPKYMLQENLREFKTPSLTTLVQYIDAGLGPARNPTIDLSPNTGGNATWTLVHDWLATCLQSHKDCNTKKDQDFTPPYLLRLSGTSESFRLVEAKEVDVGTRYVTLTHCYPYNNESLGISSLVREGLLFQQPLSALPQTYRDAFTIVSQLGLKHLWIDQLCVLQDDQTDLSMYEDKMIRRKILSNSFCGISAAWSMSPSSGLFVNRDPDLLRPFAFPFPIDSNNTLVPFKFAYAERDEGNIKRFEMEPLHQSARATHDRLLVPRMLHFTSRMVYWECHGMQCDEFGPISKDANYSCDVGTEGEMACDGKSVSKLWKPLIEVLYNQKHDNPIDQIYYRWLCFVEHYSRLQVLREEKLPLLENLVSEISALLLKEGCVDTEYLFGMWRSLIPMALPWLALGYSQRRSTAVYIPTWSWASVGSVTIRHAMETTAWRKIIVCELVDIARAWDKAGMLTTASLLLKGKLFMGRLAPSPLRSGPCTEARILSLTNYDFQLQAPMEIVRPNMMWSGTFDTEEDMREEVLCLPVTVNIFSGLANVNLPLKYYIEGIMLSRLGDGRFIRRGRWTIDRHSKEECLDAVKQLQDHVVEII